MVHLKFNLTEQEYFAFTYFNSWASPERKRYRIGYYLKVFLLYSAVAALYIFTSHSNELYIDLLVFGIIGLVYFLLVPYLIRKSVRRRVKDILSAEENAHVLDESEIILSDAGIVDKDRVSESRYDWEAIVRKAETPDSYYLYTNSYHALVIPKRTLGENEREKLGELFNRHLSLSSEFER
jgi:hypothetical protein